jgi:hypothetical protein
MQSVNTKTPFSEAGSPSRQDIAMFSGMGSEFQEFPLKTRTSGEERPQSAMLKIRHCESHCSSHVAVVVL